MRSLEDRIASLERSNRRWRFAVLAAVSAIAGIAAAKPSVSEIVRTKELEVVSAAGKTVALIRNNGTLGGATLALYGEKNKARIEITSQRDAGTIAVIGDANSAAVTDNSLRLLTNTSRDWPEKESEIAAHLDRHTMVSLGASGLAGGSVEVRNQFGKTVGLMQSNKANSGLVAVFDFDGKMQTGLMGSK